ncbi:protein RMD5 homolog [Macadamia integrifolia]|uniref:protein RMD5 homolog n=1 Tax=Macadamia integrifolia TaxID=60698 RepID=UPI001C52AD33|nr:protein RMD5 homolog [Macadamia integrifolia]
MELSTIKGAFDRVAKKQKFCFSNTQEVIETSVGEIKYTLAKLHTLHDPSPADLINLMKELFYELTRMGPLDHLAAWHKDVNGGLSKYAKLLEKSFNPDISKAYRNVDFDMHTINQIIAGHFYRLGLFDLGDCFINEAREPESNFLKSPFLDMYQILEAMGARNLQPALNWAAINREKLVKNGSSIELKLHQLEFLEILQKGSRGDALKYARTYLAPFASLRMVEIQKFMGCLLWAGRLDCSPYAEFLSLTHWEKLAEELTQQFCSLLGQSYESPLSVAIAAGVQGLPTLLKLANVMWAKKQEWQAMKQLPVPVDLGREFQFHSIFVCPVSKDQGSEENPPMLMPCGHVLCKQSIVKLSKSSTRTFKCPYCPLEATVAQCRQLYF